MQNFISLSVVVHWLLCSQRKNLATMMKTILSDAECNTLSLLPQTVLSNKQLSAVNLNRGCPRFVTSCATNIDLDAPECGVGFVPGTVESGHPNLSPITPKFLYQRVASNYLWVLLCRDIPNCHRLHKRFYTWVCSWISPGYVRS